MSDTRLSTLPNAFAAQLALFDAREWACRTALVAVGYYLCGLAGLTTLATGRHVALVWPAAGVALAAMLRFGPTVCPGVWLGALFVSMTGNAPPWVAALIAVGNTLGPVIGAWVLRRDGLHIELDRRRDLWLYCAVGVGVAMLIAATNGAFWLAAGGLIPWPAMPMAWGH